MSAARLPVQYRAQVHGNTLVGYAAVYNRRAPIRGAWEAIAPGAFDEVLRRGADVCALVDHDPSKLLGRTASGTLRLRSDTRGLAFEVELPDTSYAHDVRALVARGDLRGASFGFLPGADTLSVASDGRHLRTHTSVARLVDVSVVTMPAYEDTSVGFAPARPLAVVGRSAQLDNRTQMLLIRHRVRQREELRRARLAAAQRRQHETLLRQYGASRLTNPRRTA